MASSPALQFSHMGIHVADLSGMRDFYTRVLGFLVTDEGALGNFELVFLSRDPAEHHQMVLVSGRPEAVPFNVVNQISLRAETLADLRVFHDLVQGEGVGELAAVNHGISWSIYFKDPEGNRIELFVDSPWYIAQPVREPLDFGLPDAQILAVTEARAKREPSFRPKPEWQAEFTRRLHGGRAAG